MPIHSSPLIEIKQTRGKGRGVFAREFIAEGTVFERCPVLVIPNDEVMEEANGGVIQAYVFHWGRDTVALALGFGSMYNHSYHPNARYDDVGRMTKIFTAVCDIEAGDEITVNYNGCEDDQTPVWFDTIGTAPDGDEELSGSLEEENWGVPVLSE